MSQVACDSLCQFCSTALKLCLRTGPTSPSPHVVEGLVVSTPPDTVIDAEVVRRALCNYPNIPRASTTNQPFSYLNGCYSLDDFLYQAMLDLYHLLREKTGSHSETARQLRINRSALYQRIERGRERLKRRPCNCPITSHTPIFWHDEGMAFGSETNPQPCPTRVRFRARPARAEVAWRSFAASSSPLRLCPAAVTSLM